jgi:hypothetical protein
MDGSPRADPGRYFGCLGTFGESQGPGMFCERTADLAPQLGTTFQADHS